MSTWQRHLLERPEATLVSMDEPNEIEMAMIIELCAPALIITTGAHNKRRRSLSPPALTIGEGVNPRCDLH